MKKDLNQTYTKSALLSQLAELKLPRDRVVLVHSSLRLIGEVEGGAKTILDALIEYFTAEGGLLCIPTHTWKNLGAEITLDMSDHSTCLGAFSDFAAADDRGIRSENPSHSMMVFGDRDRALEFIADELKVNTATHPDSCYGKIYRDGGYILLIGVSHNRNTYLHCVDEMLGVPNRLTDEVSGDVAVKRLSGEIVHHKIRNMYTTFTSDISLRFPQYETAFRYHRAITDGFFGNAPTQACDAVIMKEVMELIFKNSGDKDPLADESPIPPSLYCKKI